MVGAFGGTAFAGEITGKGDPTPIEGFQAGTICTFSGHNDDPTGGGDPFGDGTGAELGSRVNNAKTVLGDGDHGANELASMINAEGPGTNCRGYASSK